MGKGTRLGELEELMLLAVLRCGTRADGGGIRDELALSAATHSV